MRRGSRIAFVVVLAFVASTIALRFAMQNLGTTSCNNKVPTDVMSLGIACDRFAEENGSRFPRNLDELLVPDVSGGTAWRGDSIPLDPWERPYRYEPPSDESAFVRVWTYGEDGIPGGEGDDLDCGSGMRR